jgi:Ca2+:H+ antiporter
MAHSRSSRDYPRSSRDYTNGRSSRDHQASSSREYTTEKTTRTEPASDRRSRRTSTLPQYNPIKFLVICGRSSSTLSMITNCLWPVVPVAIALVRILDMLLGT